MRTFTPRSSRPFRGSLQALDFGLRVRVNAHADQGTLFSGAENLSVQELTSEAAEMLSELRVRSFALRSQIEESTSALQVNIQCGFWSLAVRAAEDLAGLLGYARQRRLADSELCFRGANCASHIADLCSREVR